MKLIKQLAVIMTISFLAELMEILIPLPVAASVYGLVLMLGGLMTKIIPLEKVEGAADFLIEIMPVLFVPPTVGLIANVEALKQMVVPLFVISATTTVLIMAVTGRVSQSIIRRSHSTLGSAAEQPEGERPEESAEKFEAGVKSGAVEQFEGKRPEESAEKFEAGVKGSVAEQPEGERPEELVEKSEAGVKDDVEELSGEALSAGAETGITGVPGREEQRR